MMHSEYDDVLGHLNLNTHVVPREFTLQLEGLDDYIHKVEEEHTQGDKTRDIEDRMHDRILEVASKQGEMIT